jgi:hypothetical protein
MLATLTCLSIVPALLIELAVAATRSALDTHSPGLAAETLGGLTWSLLVCFGVAAGSALSRVSAMTASAIAFVAAPVALTAAKAVQGAVSAFVDQSVSALPPGFALIAATKACEYGFLGFVLARLATAGVERFGSHLVAGLAAAATFGVIVIALTAQAADPDLAAAALASTAINELLFPLGCVTAVFLTRRAYPHHPTSA